MSNLRHQPEHVCEIRISPLAGVHAIRMSSARAFEKHWHDCFGVGLMDEGGQVSWSGRGRVEALAGQVITVNPGEVHDGVPLQQQKRRWRMVYASPTTLNELIGLNDGIALELIRPVVEDPVVVSALSKVFSLWSETAMVTERHLLEEQLAHAWGLLSMRHGNRMKKTEPNCALAVVRTCLLDQLGEPPTLADLAQEVGLSRFQLVRHFSREFGLPPYAWLRQHQLQYAKTLIARGLDLSAAAGQSGFSDQSHMTRAFARQLGYTPGAWQRAHKAASVGSFF
jgi:AraC-like DNA-binding protein